MNVIATTLKAKSRQPSWIFAAISAAVLVAGIIIFVSAKFTDAAVKPGGEVAPPGQGGPSSSHIEGLADDQTIAPAQRKVAGDFILTAVARKNLAESWKFIHPDLRGDLTLAQWKTGDIPVVPYPIDSLDHARFSVVDRSKDAMTLEVVLIPKPGVQQPSRTFQLGLKTTGSDEHWAVDYWMPRWTPPIPANPTG